RSCAECQYPAAYDAPRDETAPPTSFSQRFRWRQRHSEYSPSAGSPEAALRLSRHATSRPIVGEAGPEKVASRILGSQLWRVRTRVSRPGELFHLARTP